MNRISKFFTTKFIKNKKISNNKKIYDKKIPYDSHPQITSINNIPNYKIKKNTYNDRED